MKVESIFDNFELSKGKSSDKEEEVICAFVIQQSRPQRGDSSEQSGHLGSYTT